MVERVRDAFFRLYTGMVEAPRGEEWEAINGLVGPDVQWSVWFIANRALRRHRHSEDYASPASQRKNAARLEKAASELRELLSKPFIRELARVHVYREGGIRLGSHEKRPIILKPADPANPAAAFDVLPELLRLFDGFAAAVRRDAPAKAGKPQDRNKRAVLWELCLVFQEYGLPLAVGENSKLPKVARHLFRALCFEGDPRDTLRTMFDEMRASGEMVQSEADTPATTEADKPGKPRPLGWWGGELPE
jgi:hypothetical protein